MSVDTQWNFPLSVLCLLNLTSFAAAANSSNGRRVCDCLPPCSESTLQKIVTYGVYPSAKVSWMGGQTNVLVLHDLRICEIIPISIANSQLQYKVAAGTQGQRDVLLDGQGGGRTGDGDEDSDDYDVRFVGIKGFLSSRLSNNASLHDDKDICRC